MLVKHHRSSDAVGFPTLGCRVAFVTLGCAKNEVDTAHMKERLEQAGFSVLDDPTRADVVVVNTCSFIQSATEESIEAILDLAALENIDAGSTKLVVAGCMPARYGEELSLELKEVSAFVPCSKEDNIVEVIRGLFLDDSGMLNASVSVQHEPCASSSLVRHEEAATARTALETKAASAYVKISDGCDRFCSYCAIPFIRGRYHSFSFADIAAEVSQRIAQGAREIVLIAQDTGRWGDDLEENDNLASLLARLAAAHPDTWFRLMYLQPEGISNTLLETVANYPNICPYFDIPLQHVDPDILRAMNRRGSAQEFAKLVEHIRAVIPDATLRTTLIVGFPGETDQRFDDLCAFVEEGFFDYVGIFPYSREENTRAFSLPDQIDEDEKMDRAQRLRDLADAVCAPIIAQRVGRRYSVLVEGREEDGQLFGRAMCQAPEVDGVVYVPDGEIGSFRETTITDTLLYEMEGE